MNLNKLNKNIIVEENGRSMVEMLGVLAIIGVLSVGGIAGYSKAMTKFKISKSMDQVSMIVANIRTLYSGQKDYSGLTISQAISSGVIPSEMANGADAITNAFAGTVLLGSVAADDDKDFYLIYTGLGQEACVALATADWGSGSSSGLVGMSVSNSAIAEGKTDAFKGTSGVNALPVSLAKAADACNCDTAVCSVGWTYF